MLGFGGVGKAVLGLHEMAREWLLSMDLIWEYVRVIRTLRKPLKIQKRH